MKSFDEVKEIIQRRRIPANLLLGNGFSIGAFPHTFAYQQIFNNADFDGHALLMQVFQRLGTHDFEKVMSYLRDLEKTQGILTITGIDFNHEIEFLKEILIRTISNSHPDRPDAITEDNYERAGNFLKFFRSTKSK